MFIFLFLVNPVIAGPVEDAMESSNKVFLYLYSPSCYTCRLFDSHYKKHMQKFGSQCKFVKVNASTPYGSKTASAVNLTHVPWVVLIDSEKRYRKTIKWECLKYFECTQEKIEAFIND